MIVASLIEQKSGADSHPAIDCGIRTGVFRDIGLQRAHITMNTHTGAQPISVGTVSC